MSYNTPSDKERNTAMTPKEQVRLSERSQQATQRLFNARVRQYLGMSGREFRDRVERGEELPDHPMVGHLLVMLGGSRRSA